MNLPQLVTNVHIRTGLERGGLRWKVPCIQPLLKPKVFSQSPQI